MSHRLRLLVLADHWGALGGGEVVAAQLARALRTRFEVAVLTTDRHRAGRADVDGITVYCLRSDYPARLRPVFGLANPLVLRDVWRVLADFRPRLLHAWNVHQHLSYASVLLARRAGTATVLTFQDALPFCYTKYHCYIERGAPCPRRPRYRAHPERCRSCWRHYWLFPPRNRILRRLLRHGVDRKVAVSQALADALADNGIRDVQVIHNGLPLDGFPPPDAAVAAVRDRFGLGAEAVVTGGRLGFFKGQHQLLEAFAELAAERPAAQLVVAGRHDDWYGQMLQRRAEELELSRRVIFTGFLPHAEFLALLGAGALFGSLSLYLDPFPTVNLEAGAAGRPVLGTCFGGTPEIVLDRETGRLVNPYLRPDVVAALRDLLADPSERARLGQRAAERIRARFPLSAMADAYATLFHSLV